MLDGTVSLGEDDDFAKALQDLAPQIQDLTVAEAPSGALFTSGLPWPAFTSIRRLALYSQRNDPVALFSRALNPLPTASISRLLIGYSRNPAQPPLNVAEVWRKKIIPALLQSAVAGVGSFPQLGRLVVHFGDEEVEIGTRASMKELDEAMHKRGGELERRVGWESELLGWERYVEVRWVSSLASRTLLGCS